MNEDISSILANLIEAAAKGENLHSKFKGDKGENGTTPKITTGYGKPKDNDTKLYIDIMTGDIWENV